MKIQRGWEARGRIGLPERLIELRSAAEGLMKQATKGTTHGSDLEGVLGPVRFETRILRLDDVIQQHIRIVLFACNGNKQEAPWCSASAVLRSIARSMMNPPPSQESLQTESLEGLG